MFTPEPWAAAFVSAAGEVLEEAVEALNLFIHYAQKIPGTLSGTADGLRLERIFRKSMEAPEIAGMGAEYACRIAVLLVRKGFFSRRNVTALLEKIESLRDRANGVLTVRVDSAFPLDEGFQESLKETLREGVYPGTGARDIKLISHIVPELLGGYRLQIGGESVDGSLRFLLQKMAAHLQAAPLETGGVP
jgi:hypothetical protein